MGINPSDDEKYFTFPSEEEMQAAQAACCGKCCSACEAPASYAWRKRDIDISILLEKAIEQELSEIEREIITEYFYNGKNLTEIAMKRKVSQSATGKTLERALEKLRRALKYVILYQHDVQNESIVPLAVRRAQVISGARNSSGGSICRRLSDLRKRENLSRKAVSDCIGIDEQRLGSLERGEKIMLEPEIIALSNFYGVTTDYILKGDKADDGN